MSPFERARQIAGTWAPAAERLPVAGALRDAATAADALTLRIINDYLRAIG